MAKSVKKPQRRAAAKRKKLSTKRRARRNPADSFIAVARRLEADEDKATFEAKLGKIARATP